MGVGGITQLGRICRDSHRQEARLSKRTYFSSQGAGMGLARVRQGMTLSQEGDIINSEWRLIIGNRRTGTRVGCSRTF